jgi:tRNA dimethylallyltransferase
MSFTRFSLFSRSFLSFSFVRHFSLTPRPRVLLLTGPTSSRKSALAIRLASRLNGEIISCDSVQVYQLLNIGSGKVDLSSCHGIRHHLLDFLPLNTPFSACDWSQEAHKIIKDITARGKVPLIVGGSVFYLHWFLHGRESELQVDYSRRSELTHNLSHNKQEIEKFIKTLTMNQPSREYLNHLLSSGASRKRIIRAIEIIESSGGKE